jgi:hypothetical protein
MQGISIVKTMNGIKLHVTKERIREVVKIAIKGGQLRGYFASFIIVCFILFIVAVVLAMQVQPPQVSVGNFTESFHLYSIFAIGVLSENIELYACPKKRLSNEIRL